MKWIRRHLAVKLLMLTFLIAVVPFVGVLVYSHVSEQRLYTEYFLKEHHEQMAHAAANIESHLTQIYRELGFLAGSVVMDDILVNDLDGRIVSLLERYKAIYDVPIELLALDMNGMVVASTRQPHTGEPYEHYRAFEAGVGRSHPVMAGGDLLLFEKPVHLGMGRDRVIGYVLMEYPLDNLGRFNLQSRQVTTVLFDPVRSRHVGIAMPSFPVSDRTGIHQSVDAIWFYVSLAPKMPDWYLGYRIDRTEQLSMKRELNRFLALMLLFGVAMIAAAAYWFSRRIVAPLGLLQQRASEMVSFQRYDRAVPVNSEDEIGQLAASFNALADEIRTAFDALRRENFFRVRRLTQMIGLFNHLLQTEEESECLKTALDELKTIAPEYNVRFTRYGSQNKMPSLYVFDFDHETLKYYGSLMLPEGLEEEEQAFFRAIASMIAARIEQIRAYRRLHRDAAAKTAFISHMSHDLRTPLHAILSQTQFLIGYGNLNDTGLERVGGIEHSAQQLLGMINDLLDLARLDSGKYEPELEMLTTADVAEIFGEVEMLLSPLAEQKAIGLQVSEVLPEGAVVADRRFLRQIILNLVSNAIKFTEEGSVTCRLEKIDSTLCLVIRDTGRGMSEQTLQRVFEPFVQSEGEDSTRGSGLGLALSRRFAQLFGAELTLTSSGPGRGSEARICFTTL